MHRLSLTLLPCCTWLPHSYQNSRQEEWVRVRKCYKNPWLSPPPVPRAGPRPARSPCSHTNIGPCACTPHMRRGGLCLGEERERSCFFLYQRNFWSLNCLCNSSLNIYAGHNEDQETQPSTQPQYPKLCPCCPLTNNFKPFIVVVLIFFKKHTAVWRQCCCVAHVHADALSSRIEAV